MNCSVPQSCKVYTSEPLANAIVSAVGVSGDHDWLEPSVGPGVFLHVLARSGVPSDKITAIDLSPIPEPTDRLAKTYRGVDFLEWASSTEQRFDRIVANPPFLSLREIQNGCATVASRIVDVNGSVVPRSANLWYLFLVSALRLLKQDGNLGFILPASWEYANYARTLRKSFHRLFADVEIHRSRQPLFPKVQDGCIVLVAKNYGRKPRSCHVFQHRTAQQLISAVGSNEPTVTRVPEERYPKCIGASPRVTRRPLGDVMTIRLGGVTGHSRYFLLTERRRLELGLPVEALHPVVTRARHLSSAQIDQTFWETLRHLDERVWLFRPDENIIVHPAVKAYLELPTEDGGCDRDRRKIKSRAVWHRTPLPEHVDGFLSGMSSLGPWICLRTMPGLNATNTLYTVHFTESLTLEEKSAWSISLLTSRVRLALQSVGRIYPDGLLKLEPGDLHKIELDTPTRVAGAFLRYQDILGLLRCGDDIRSQALADEWFL